MKHPRKVKISTFGSQITSAISVALVLILLGGMAMTLAVSHRLAENIRSNISIVVKLLPGASQAETARVNALIASRHDILSSVYSSPDKILEEESALMGEDLSDILGQNPFGGEFELKIAPEAARTDSIAGICAMFASDPAVDEIVTQSEVVDNVNSFLRKVSLILFIIAVILLVISFVLINNTVSLAVYSRRFIIHTMKLVGATPAFIKRPFIIAGLVTGVISAAVAIAAVAAVRAYAVTFDPSVDTLLDWPTMVWIFAAMLALGTLICTGAAALAATRYVRASYDDMFK